MIKITDGLWVAIAIIQRASELRPGSCMVFTETGAYDIEEPAADFAQRVNLVLRSIHQTPDYRE